MLHKHTKYLFAVTDVWNLLKSLSYSAIVCEPFSLRHIGPQTFQIPFKNICIFNHNISMPCVCSVCSIVILA